jgi:hypothetical protein
MPQGIVRAGFPRAMGAALLAGLLSLPFSAEARDPDAGRASTLTQQSIIRDKDGFRVGRMDRKPDGDIILRDKNGFRTGRLDADGRGGYTVRDKEGFRTGRIDPPR